MAVKYLQITQAGAAVQVAPIGTYARWILFQDTGAAAMTLGDATVSASNGYVLAATTGQLLLPPIDRDSAHYDLGQFWTVGTSLQYLQIIYDSMN